MGNPALSFWLAPTKGTPLKLRKKFVFLIFCFSHIWRRFHVHICNLAFLCALIREAKVARLTGGLLAVGCVCHLPLFVLNMVALLLGDEKVSHLLHVVRECGGLLLVVRSVLNPLLYYYHNVSLRLRVRRLLHLQRTPSRRESTPTVQDPHPVANENEIDLAVSTM